MTILNKRGTGIRLLSERTKRGMSQAEAARAIGVSSQSISNWERGKLPSVINLLALADLYDMDLDEIVMYERRGHYDE